jgi:hypothetical protein
LLEVFHLHRGDRSEELTSLGPSSCGLFGLVVVVNDFAFNDRKILRRKPIPRPSVAGGGQSRILIAAAADSDIEFDPLAIGGGGGEASWPPASVLD